MSIEERTANANKRALRPQNGGTDRKNGLPKKRRRGRIVAATTSSANLLQNIFQRSEILSRGARKKTVLGLSLWKHFCISCPLTTIWSGSFRSGQISCC